MTLAETYKALADESRLKLLFALSCGSFNVQELTFILALSQPTVSHHLKVLERAGMISSKKEGTWAYYSLKQTPLESTSSPIPSPLRNGHLGATLAHHALSIFDASDEGQAKDRVTARVEEILGRRRTASLAYFDKVAPTWRALRNEAVGTAIPVEKLRSYVPDAATFADLGCGSGAVLRTLLPRAGRTIGIDYSKEMLEVASKELADAKVELSKGSLEALPLDDESVDVALCYMVLHHIAHPERALNEIARVVRPSGVLLIVEFFEHQDESMRERFADLWLGFDPDSLSDWLQKSGFFAQPLTALPGEKRAFLLPAVRAAVRTQKRLRA